MFKVEIKTGNEAFENDESNYELRRILRVISEKLEMGYDRDIIMDINRNKVGKWSLDV